MDGKLGPAAALPHTGIRRSRVGGATGLSPAQCRAHAGMPRARRLAAGPGRAPPARARRRPLADRRAARARYSAR